MERMDKIWQLWSTVDGESVGSGFGDIMDFVQY